MSASKKYTITLDDDPTMAPVIAHATGIHSIAFAGVNELVGALGTHDPVAVFIDVHMEPECGLDVIPKLRRQWPYAALIVITSDPADALVAKALACGADDFVMKPIRPAELLARLQARLKDLAQKEGENRLRIGDVFLDVAYHLLKGKRAQRHLSETEINLLKCLSSAQGTVVARETLKWQGWGEAIVSDSALDRKMHELRQALRDTSQVVSLKNVYGEGFSLQVESKPTESRRSSMKSQDDPEVLDAKKLRSLRELNEEGMPDFVTELAEIYLAETPPLLQRLQDAVRQGDAEGTKQLAHKMKGMSFNIGANGLAKIFEQIEAHGRNQEPQACGPVLVACAAEHARVAAALTRITKQAA